ncbi:MAG: type II toxin-antitoxin system RelE/ParE family toxin [Betaproteobacteria bacterium]|nr:type II toxin-antitoxin system RelE/ParE family toxin [Betaproteobacteria bacterium]
MAWTIEYAASARKQFRQLDKQIARRILDYMDTRVATSHDPRKLGKALSGPLGELWRYRVGDYRVICSIHDDLLCVLVVKLGKRGDVYS